MGHTFGFVVDNADNYEAKRTPPNTTSSTGTYCAPVSFAVSPESASLKNIPPADSSAPKNAGAYEFACQRELDDASMHSDMISQCRLRVLASRADSWLDAMSAMHEDDLADEIDHVGLACKDAKSALESVRRMRAEEEQRLKIAEEQRLKIAEEQRLSREAAEAAEAQRLENAKKLAESPGDVEYTEMEAMSRDLIAGHASLSLPENYSAKPHILEARMAINRRVGQIANSRKQVSDIVRDLARFVGELRRLEGDVGAGYALVVISQKIIDQAETQVCLHTPSSFPIAQVAVDLGVQERQFLPLLAHNMHRRCPYLIPRYIKQQPGQKTVDYRRTLGYTVTEEGSLESETSFGERMAGIICLFGAITQTEPTMPGVSNPFGLHNGWNWLARVLNMHPEPITPFLVCSFLESAGYRLWKLHGEMFVKMMRCVQTQILDLIPSSSVAAKTRLEIFLAAFFKANPPTLEPPQGYALLP